MDNVHRILDANFNRAREALRVLEDFARFVLDDSDLTARAKQIRHDLCDAIRPFGLAAMVGARDTPGDVGTGISTESERRRADGRDVAVAAALRCAEALRSIEEYGKTIHTASAGVIEQIRYKLYALQQDIEIGGPRRARLRRSRLHVLVTAALCRGDWFGVAEQAIAGGADVIQLREKELSDQELLDRAARLRKLTRRKDALLIINDRPDIARIVDADGVHLGQDDLPVAAARAVLGPQRIIGKSTHGTAEALDGLAEGADYIGVGPVFRSPTKPDVPVQGPEILAKVAAKAAVPIVAIGGVTAETVPALIRSVAATPATLQVAVSSFVIAAADPAAAVRAIRRNWAE